MQCAFGRRRVQLGARSGPGNKDLSINLAGYTLAPVSGKYLQYTVAIQTGAAEADPVLIKAVDSIAVIASLSNVVFDQMHGTLAPRTVEVDQTQNINFDFSSKLSGDMQFSQAKMWAVLSNRANVPVQVDKCKVTGLLGGTSKTAVLTVPDERIQGGGETTVPFQDGEVLNFLNTFSDPFADKLHVTGSVVLNPDGTPGSASSHDSVSAVLWVEIPLEFSMKNGVINDTSAMTMSKENQQRFENVNAGTITFDLENHMPADMTLETAILDQNYNVLLTPRAVDGSEITVPAASVDGQGRVAKASQSTTSINFNAQDFKKLVLSKWIKVKLRMNTDQARTVAFRTTDYIKVRAYATLNVSSTIVN